MKRHRSIFFIVFLLSAAVSLLFVVYVADATAKPPTAAYLQAGDLIWPKKPGTLVRCNSRPGEADKSDAVRWREEQENYLAQLRSNSNSSPEEKERYAALQKMTYEEFISYYLGDRIPGRPAAFGIGGIEVGHVGIIEIISRIPFVVRQYGILVFSGYLMQIGCRNVRVNEIVPPEERAAVAEKASEQIGKPYSFSDFDLKDANSFYCSKLAWLSVLLGAGLSCDDNAIPKRILWYSPQQLMMSKHRVDCKSW